MGREHAQTLDAGRRLGERTSQTQLLLWRECSLRFYDARVHATGYNHSAAIHSSRRLHTWGGRPILASEPPENEARGDRVYAPACTTISSRCLWPRSPLCACSQSRRRRITRSPCAQALYSFGKGCLGLGRNVTASRTPRLPPACERCASDRRSGRASPRGGRCA
jgi:hypothetical protein